MLIIAEVIIHKFQGKSFRIIENRALNINTNSLIFVFIETTTIAIKDKGITYSRFNDSGIEGPIKIPTNVEICQDVHNVIPLPSR